MRRFGLKVEVLMLVFVLSFAHLLKAYKVLHNSSGDGKVEKCTTKDGGKVGVCIEIGKCDEATKILANGLTKEQKRFLQQRTCKLKGKTTFVCCVTSGSSPKPLTTRSAQPPPPPTAGSASRRMTESDLNKVCGITKTLGIRVVGGTPAVLGAWPWMAAIFVGPSRDSVGCGGVLISEQYVLTAAHCIIDKATGQKRKISDYVIRLGDLNINDTKDGATPIDLSAAELITHKDYFYSKSTVKNDIALIKLNRSVSFTHLITPICLPSAPPMSNDLYLDKSPYIAGWGTVEFQGKPSSALRQVMLSVNPNSACQKAYTEFKLTIADSQLCAGFRLGGKDACQKDSGGPLMLLNVDNKWFTIGVISNGFKCAEAEFPGIYTRTAAYIDWIRKNANIQ